MYFKNGTEFKYLGTATNETNWEQFNFMECLLPFSPDYFVAPCLI